MIRIGVGVDVTAGGAPSGFSPLSLSPIAWFDGSDSATITLNGAKVSQWNDKSGNGYHVSQGVSGAQPTYTTAGQNGLNVLTFVAGNLTVLTRASVTVSQPYTVAKVIRYTAGIAIGVTTVDVSLADLNAYSTYIGEKKWSAFNGTVLRSTGDADTSAHQVTSIHNNTATSIRVDGSVVAGPATTGATNGSRINIGAARGSDGLSAFSGFVAEVVIVSGALSGANLTDLETYLKNKWGTP